MAKKFDILFIDGVSYKHYDTAILDVEPLGGTEATVIRVAEGLAARGYTVGVANKHTLEPTMGAYAYYLPLNDDLINYSPDHVVSLRGTTAMAAFPKAYKYSWQHDFPDKRILDMVPAFLEHNAVVIGVSDFHKNELSRWFTNENWAKVPKTVRIYNPVDPRIEVARKTKVAYDRNSIVWAASPHKGLDQAIEQFKILKAILPSVTLKVFHAGYIDAKFYNVDGVMNYGAVPCQRLWQEMSASLCTFYPTDFIETFGLIAAESNAVHTPIATMGIGALTESVQSSDQLVSRYDYAGLLKKVETWYNEPNTRPEVCLQPRFALQGVIDQWIQLMNSRKPLR